MSAVTAAGHEPEPPHGGRRPPLAGVRVVVTRADRQAGALRAALEAAGATVEALPLLAVLPPSDPAPLAAATGRLDSYRWVVFTSANAVDAVADRTVTWPAAVRLAAVGEGTSRALATRSLAPSLIAARTQAEGLLAELLPAVAPGDRVLLPQAADARPVLASGLRAAGVTVDVVEAYRKETPAEAAVRSAALFPAGQPIGWVTFTSPSIAAAFAALFGGDWPAQRASVRAASIGPVTSNALRQLGVEPAAEAARAGDAELVAALLAAHEAGG
jgi:uroporphyrinogen-III synthase